LENIYLGITIIQGRAKLVDLRRVMGRLENGFLAIKHCEFEPLNNIDVLN